MYEWELQRRGVWHLHVVVGMETAVERAWAIGYVHALRELAPRYGFGFVDAKPLPNPEPAKQVACCNAFSSTSSSAIEPWRRDEPSRCRVLGLNRRDLLLRDHSIVGTRGASASSRPRSLPRYLPR